jgi:hypothetical protein
MVPFSFPPTLLKSRVIMRQLMVESLELRAASVTCVTVDDRRRGPSCGKMVSGVMYQVDFLLRKSQFVNRKSRNSVKSEND